MSDSSRVPGLVRYWPTLAIVAALAPVAKGYVVAEPVRGAIAIVCIGLAVHQLRNLRAKQRFSLSGLLSLTLLMFPSWLLLSVIRDYSYPTHSPWRTLPLYSAVVHLQEYLTCAIVGMVLVVTVWATMRVAHWLAARDS